MPGRDRLRGLSPGREDAKANADIFREEIERGASAGAEIVRLADLTAGVADYRHCGVGHDQSLTLRGLIAAVDQAARASPFRAAASAAPRTIPTSRPGLSADRGRAPLSWWLSPLSVVPLSGVEIGEVDRG